jgi:crotonobetainyl-CoA:carnitine CoA-transferase CaiB-like acyl-CoA transferase
LVTTSLYRQGAYTVSFDLNTVLMTGQQIAIGQRETMANPCMNNYTAADGRRFWIVGLDVSRHWPSLCRVVGRPEWIERYPTPRDRFGNAREIIAELDTIFATRPLAEWEQEFAGEPDFFWSPISSLDEVLADEQFYAAGGIVDVPEGDSSTPMVATPADFAGTPWQPRGPAPSSASTPRRSAQSWLCAPTLIAASSSPICARPIFPP